MITDVNEILPYLNNPVNRRHTTQIIADCPFCGKSKHFFINKKTLKFDCKKCKEDGAERKLLRQIGAMHLLGSGKALKINNPFLTIYGKEIEEVVETEEEYVNNYKTLLGFERCYYDDNSDVSNYLIGRKFTKIDFELHEVGKTNLISKYENFAIIHIINDFIKHGFVGRNMDHNEGERYKNSKGTKFARLLFGLDELTDTTKDIILTEGIFDKISITTEFDLHNDNSLKCLGTFGNKISDTQIKILSRYEKVQNFFLFFDARDSVEIMKTYSYLLANTFKHKNVYVCYLETGDPGSSDVNTLYNVLMKSVRHDVFFRKYVQNMSKIHYK